MKNFDDLCKETMSPEAIKQAEVKGAELLTEYTLSEIRRLCNVAQQEVATALDVKQPSISDLEKRPDMLISTLSNYLDTLGIELELTAKMPDGHRVSIHLAK